MSEMTDWQNYIDGDGDGDWGQYLNDMDDQTISGYIDQFTNGDDDTIAGYVNQFMNGDDDTLSSYFSEWAGGDGGN